MHLIKHYSHQAPLKYDHDDVESRDVKVILTHVKLLHNVKKNTIFSAKSKSLWCEFSEILREKPQLKLG